MMKQVKKLLLNKIFNLNLEVFLGIDLAGSSKNPSGLARIKNFKVITKIVYKDEEIVKEGEHSRFIYIDAPLSLPKGRKSLEERNNYHFRNCDLKLKELGIKFFPITLGGMRKLTERGMKLKAIFNQKGKEVFEVFPGAFYDVFGIKRKDRNLILDFYENFLNDLGLTLERKTFTQDELDAIACLLTGILYKIGEGRELSGEDGCIIIPKKL